ncbi:hypothetical protein ABIA18_001350 [Sinorhizobium fredii]
MGLAGLFCNAQNLTPAMQRKQARLAICQSGLEVSGAWLPLRVPLLEAPWEAEGSVFAGS